MGLESGTPKPRVTRLLNLCEPPSPHLAKLDDNFCLLGLHRQVLGVGCVQVTPLPTSLDVASCSPEGGSSVEIL